MNLFNLSVLGILSLLLSSVIAIPTDISSHMETRHSLGEQDILGSISLRATEWPCLLLPERFQDNLGSLDPGNDLICRLWSDSTCSETSNVAIISNPGNVTSDLFSASVSIPVPGAGQVSNAFKPPNIRVDVRP
ncbi:hypothetical protein V8F20_005512 [Naviculisporaceae sp. PSN 640]